MRVMVCDEDKKGIALNLIYPPTSGTIATLKLTKSLVSKNLVMYFTM